MSIRNKLVIFLSILLILGIIAIDIFTYESLSSFLTNRSTVEIDTAASQIYRLLYSDYIRNRKISPNTGRFLENALTPDIYVELLSKQKTSIFVIPAGNDPPPKIDERLPVSKFPPRKVLNNKNKTVYFPQPRVVETTAIGDKNLHYLMEAVAVPQGTLIVAEDLADSAATLSHLLEVEIIVTLIVLLAMVIGVVFVIRKGLKPLEKITDVAKEISKGDFSRRIDYPNEKSEIGNLAEALNIMLSKIQQGFEEKAVTEENLRQFLADASHELRTPVTTIRGYSELIKKGAINEPQEIYSATLKIEKEAERLGLILDDLLLLARLDAGRPLELKRTDLASLLAEIVDDFQIAYPSNPIELEVKESLYAEADAGRLSQALSNLISNSIVHNPPKTAIKIKMDEENLKAAIFVTDFGNGIDESIRKRIFERFYRGDKKSQSGSGLGLSIASAIVKAHGGTIELLEGLPTTFKVMLPIKRRVKQIGLEVVRD
jgi:two-component system OmpR family sensor kinase